MFLNTNPIGTLPPRAIKMVSGVFQDFRQRALGIGRYQEQADRLVYGQSRGLRSRAATGHIHRHGMGNKLGAIPPDLYYVINVHKMVVPTRASYTANRWQASDFDRLTDNAAAWSGWP